ncbi:MAG: hypothetical protein D6705_15600 [Deltaproteobacteria bacterium]|nr:MAG: hypothetical protein D6705_15600 [Deltaproteobacteria bacterium]
MDASAPRIRRIIVLVACFAASGCEDREQRIDPTITAGLTSASGTSGAPGTSAADDGGDDGMLLDVGESSGGNTAGDGTCGCTNVMDGIYVLNTDPPSVWFFDPPANTFTQIGALSCPAPPGFTANSMAIDREGNAWINYYEVTSQTGKMFKAPLWALDQCEELPYVNPNQSWWLLGMGYAVTDPQSSCDELFVYRSDRYLEYPNFSPGGSQLGRYDDVAHVIDVIGDAAYPVAELTGTGDGRLFGFAAVSQGTAKLVEFDKDTAAEKASQNLSIDITNAFAFAFWGGDVYLFTETSPLSGVSKVTRLDYDGNEGGGLSTYNPNTGIHIAGAGVSTCASFQPPG